MKLYPLGILIIVVQLMIGCLGFSESWQHVDVSDFSEKVRNRTDIEIVDDLILEYYNYPAEEEEAKNIKVSSEQRRGTFVATLVHDRIADDSMRGIQLTMTAIKKKDGWEVLGVQKNWKCWEGRGHTTWGVAPCN